MALCRKVCRDCSSLFTARSGAAIRCDECRTIVCKQCGTRFAPQSGKLETTEFCSKSCVGSARFGSWQNRLKQNTRYTEKCWHWLGLKDRNGYGILSRRDQPLKAHRAAYEVAYGAIPKGLSVLHHCDYRGCVRPDHLFLGTQADNVSDMVSKNRQSTGPRTTPDKISKGEDRFNAQLNVSAVHDIRARYEPGKVTLKMLAAEYGVHPGTIQAVVDKRSWRHV